MKNLTTSQKSSGEMAIKRLSKAAQQFYNEASPLDVYEVDDGEEVTYSVRSAIGDYDELSLTQLDSLFSELNKQVQEEEAE